MPLRSHLTDYSGATLSAFDYPLDTQSIQSMSFADVSMTTNPAQVQGAWRRGWTLDRHLTSSVFLGDDENGHPRFENVRSPIGELLYQLKYRGQRNAQQVAAVMAGFFDDKPKILSHFDLVVPVPPSTARAVQPVVEVAGEIASKRGKTAAAN